MARFLNKALFSPQKLLLVSYLPNTWIENPLNTCKEGQMCFLCTMINGGRMHYMRLFGFKASLVQRYFFLDNFILCCRYSGSQTDFGGSTWKRISRKYHQISSQLPSWVHQQERFADQQHAIWWCSNWNMQPEEAIEMQISQTRRFCLINACFVKSQSPIPSMQVCADDLNVPYPANYMIR